MYDESVGNLGEVMEPLCALSETLEGNTIVIQGLINGSKITILINIGSSHSYISSSLGKKLGLSFIPVESMSTKTANGSTVVSEFSVLKTS